MLGRESSAACLKFEFFHRWETTDRCSRGSVAKEQSVEYLYWIIEGEG